MNRNSHFVPRDGKLYCMRGYYGNHSLVGANGREPPHDGGSIYDNRAALELAQRTPGNFIGLQALHPVDDRGVLLSVPPEDLQGVDRLPETRIEVLPSRSALDSWFKSITYETRTPGYSHTIMGIDKTKPMSVLPDGTQVPHVAFAKTFNVPRSTSRIDPAEVKAKDPSDLWWKIGISAVLAGAAYLVARPMFKGLQKLQSEIQSDRSKSDR